MTIRIIFIMTLVACIGQSTAGLINEHNGNKCVREDEKKGTRKKKKKIRTKENVASDDFVCNVDKFHFLVCEFEKREMDVSFPQNETLLNE